MKGWNSDTTESIEALGNNIPTIRPKFEIGQIVKPTDESNSDHRFVITGITKKFNGKYYGGLEFEYTFEDAFWGVTEAGAFGEDDLEAATIDDTNRWYVNKTLGDYWDYEKRYEKENDELRHKLTVEEFWVIDQMYFEMNDYDPNLSYWLCY